MGRLAWFVMEGKGRDGVERTIDCRQCDGGFGGVGHDGWVCCCEAVVVLMGEGGSGCLGTRVADVGECSGLASGGDICR